MPDSDPGLSLVCPACGRRVPRTVVTCRCGADLPRDASVAPDPETGKRQGTALTAIAGGVAVVTALAAAGYWSFTQPPARPISTEVTRPGTIEGRLIAPPAAGTGQEVSAERRAWDATLADANTRKPDAPGPPTVPDSVPAAALEPAALEDVVSRVMPAVVLVETSTGRGSGFFVRPDTLLTNVHVVQSDGFVKLRRIDGTTTSARVDSRSPDFDIAVLKVSPALPNQPVIAMGSADTLRPGQEVITIGSALGTLQNSVSRGIVSGVRQSGNATLVQTDAAANPGNSGGPLLDRNGTAIGITTMGYRDQQGLNFAVAIDHARAILDGRPAASTATPSAMNDLQTLSPAIRSESDRAFDMAQRTFLTSAEGLARAADRMDVEWRPFRQSCYTTAIPGSYGHEWFALLSRRITTSQVPHGSCATFLDAFQQEADRFASEMKRALETARRAGVLPGVVRDTLRSNRLEFDGWDR